MSDAVYVGVDVGSSATKGMVLDGGGKLLGHHVVPSGFDYGKAVEEVLTCSLAMADRVREDVAGCVATGYGRNRVDIAGRTVTEITCHARGAREWNASVRNIIDIGGQDTKVIRLDARGRMVDYRMNAKCAAGTGTFLESVSARLGVSLSELDQLAMKCATPTVVNSYCTVFAGTEVIERIKEGQACEDISMGLFRSIASRVSEMVSTREGAVAATGGVVSHCEAMVRALGEVLECEILLPPMPQHAGAYGAAWLALEASREAASDSDAADAP